MKRECTVYNSLVSVTSVLTILCSIGPVAMASLVSVICKDDNCGDVATVRSLSMASAVVDSICVILVILLRYLTSVLTRRKESLAVLRTARLDLLEKISRAMDDGKISHMEFSQIIAFLKQIGEPMGNQTNQ